MHGRVSKAVDHCGISELIGVDGAGQDVQMTKVKCQQNAGFQIQCYVGGVFKDVR